MPLELYVDNEKEAGHTRQYATYLLPLFVQLQTSQPDLARTSWEQFEQLTNSLAAINGQLDGGFTKQWPKFALLNVNREPVDTFWKSDKVPSSYSFRREEVKLNGAPYVTIPLDGTVKHLAAHTYSFRFDDPSVRSVAFENPFTRGNFPNVNVQAVYRTVSGRAVTEELDWAGVEYILPRSARRAGQGADRRD